MILQLKINLLHRNKYIEITIMVDIIIWLREYRGNIRKYTKYKNYNY